MEFAIDGVLAGWLGWVTWRLLHRTPAGPIGPRGAPGIAGVQGLPGPPGPVGPEIAAVLPDLRGLLHEVIQQRLAEGRSLQYGAGRERVRARLQAIRDKRVAP